VSSTRRGCLLIADIGGYTRYLSGVELEHSTDVLADLLQTVVDALEPNVRIAKVEGDAVFVFDEGQADGPVVVDAVTGAYIAFMRRRRSVLQLTTCPCDACRSIGELGLKVVAHRGDYATHEVAGATELVGREVILVHRLLKNDVIHRTGIGDYALYTDPLVRDLGLAPAALGWRSESLGYGDVGEVAVYVDDLASRWQGEAETAKHLIPETEGATVVWELPAPPPVVWERLSHPEHAIRFMADTASQTSPTGARGPGTATHCVHGSQSYDLEVLDWIPYRLQALRFRTRGLTFLYNSIYEELAPDRTRLTARIAPLAPRFGSLLFPLVRRSIRKQYQSWMRALEELLITEADNGREDGRPSSRSSETPATARAAGSTRHRAAPHADPDEHRNRGRVSPADEPTTSA
jgi:hypothetical protein